MISFSTSQVSRVEPWTAPPAASAVRQRLRAQASCLGIMSRTVRRHSWLLPTVPRVVEAPPDDVAPPLLALTVMRTLIVDSCGGKATTRKCNGWRRFSLQCRQTLFAVLWMCLHLRRNRRSRPRTLTPHLLDGVDLVVVLDLVDDKR